MKSLTLIIGIIRVIMILCVDRTKQVMAFPATSTTTTTPAATLLSLQQLQNISSRLVSDSRNICQRFERDRLEGLVSRGQRCQDPVQTVTPLSPLTLLFMSKQSILETLEVNLLRFVEPLHDMTVRETSWPGLHIFYMPYNGQRGFEDLENDVTVLLNDVKARIRLLEPSTVPVIPRTIISEVTYNPASTAAVDTDRANHLLLRTLVTFSRQVRSLTITYVRKEFEAPS
ncbi:uncharacterized protein LOC584559 [Strongylocentrotus purpuratus]|uniref:Uncharacterized protein n=1 Tax=Strongylocentrotus purpuratus TaxID=7668 RepID=A0A7M7RGX1_STRPU|nr:uncharacterized protein LOC584559 [Strongylocentrotus purpuratus]|eukprot:XP_800291.2 PREDICTED: uncharacterized protein LOC584559 isoform X2 [Strongylocentrotus purpuratus]